MFENEFLHTFSVLRPLMSTTKEFLDLMLTVRSTIAVIMVKIEAAISL